MLVLPSQVNSLVLDEALAREPSRCQVTCATAESTEYFYLPLLLESLLCGATHLSKVLPSLLEMIFTTQFLPIVILCIAQGSCIGKAPIQRWSLESVKQSTIIVIFIAYEALEIIYHTLRLLLNLLSVQSFEHL